MQATINIDGEPIAVKGFVNLLGEMVRKEVMVDGKVVRQFTSKVNKNGGREVSLCFYQLDQRRETKILTVEESDELGEEDIIVKEPRPPGTGEKKD